VKTTKKRPRGAAAPSQIKNYSEFRQKVWLACAKIPAGKTATYSQIAAAIGNPRAARAVGQALAANPFAPAIPCHRVVRADGKTGGYSALGGPRKKISLLKKEGAHLKSIEIKKSGD
jgi:O-6-methylguanine DNA methyltransferase